MATLSSGLADVITDGEDLARFLTHRNKFAALMAKPAAFLPAPKDRETLVSRHGREPLERLWGIGLIAAGDCNLYGAAIFKASAVRSAKLEVMPDEPPPRHAVIRGWPWIDVDPDLQKAKQKECATLIASQAALVIR